MTPETGTGDPERRPTVVCVVVFSLVIVVVMIVVVLPITRVEGVAGLRVGGCRCREPVGVALMTGDCGGGEPLGVLVVLIVGAADKGGEAWAEEGVVPSKEELAGEDCAKLSRLALEEEMEEAVDRVVAEVSDDEDAVESPKEDFLCESDSPVRRRERRLARIIAPATDFSRNFRELICSLSMSCAVVSSRSSFSEFKANHLCSRQARAVTRRRGSTTSMCLIRSLASSETCRKTGCRNE